MQQSLRSNGEDASTRHGKRVLFVGYGNSCRSQMAEAFARHYGMGFLAAASAGLDPDQRVSPQARAVMAERGIPLNSMARAKPLSDFDPASFDLTVFLTEFDIPMEAESMMKIQTPDVRRADDQLLRRVRDEIEGRVVEIVNQMRPQPRYWPILLAYRDVRVATSTKAAARG